MPTTIAIDDQVLTQLLSGESGTGELIACLWHLQAVRSMPNGRISPT